MDNTINTNANIVLDKKIKDEYYYDDRLDNFKAPHELTVEITLREYRRLTATKAVHDYEMSKALKDKHDLNDQLKELQRQYNELKNKYLAVQMGGDGGET